MIGAVPSAKALLADAAYDADCFRLHVIERVITACIPSKMIRKMPIPQDTPLYRRRHKVGNILGKLKAWRRTHTRYDRSANAFMSAVCIAATNILWLTH